MEGGAEVERARARRESPESGRPAGERSAGDRRRRDRRRGRPMGLCVLLGVAADDDDAVAERLAGRVARLRIFENEEGKFDRSVVDVHGGALVVSQFTLIADTVEGQPAQLRRGGPARAGGAALRGLLPEPRETTVSTSRPAASAPVCRSSSSTTGRSRSFSKPDASSGKARVSARAPSIEEARLRSSGLPLWARVVAPLRPAGGPLAAGFACECPSPPGPSSLGLGQTAARSPSPAHAAARPVHVEIW